MKNCFKIMPVLVLIFIGCEKKEIKFEQPKILSAKCKFDFALMNFGEDAKQLTSKVLDTAATESYSDSDEKMYDRKTVDYLSTGVKRIGYITLEKQDSIAHFGKLFFDRVYVEKDDKNKIKAVVGYAKFRDEKEIPRLLKSLYEKYKQTLHGLEDLGSDYYPGYYSGQDLDYEWKLHDRFFQVHIENGREISMGTNAEDNYNIEYFYVQFLMVPPDEYQRMKDATFNELVKNRRIMIIGKNYYNFESLNLLSGRNSSKTLDIFHNTSNE